MSQGSPLAFQEFELERYQSLYEHTVEINLADSSVQCLTTRDWLTEDERQALLDTALYYPQVNGTERLRERIAALYPGARADNVLVTVGAAQANSMTCAALLHPGDEVVVVSPGYRQVWGLARNLGCAVKELVLRPERDWRPDLDELDALVGPRTRLMGIVNPSNPTGIVLTPAEMERMVAACARVGAWLHADEVYIGTERAGQEETPSFWGRYDRVVCTNSLSKAYGLAGLRIGWALADADTIQALWRRHEYAVIAAAAPSMTLGEIALGPEKRRVLIDRQRRLAREGWAAMNAWLAKQDGVFSVRQSAATCIALVRYELQLSSYELAELIRQHANVLVSPGSLLGAEGHLRITVGYPAAKVRGALDRISEALAPLAPSKARSLRT
jgi:aspartate/methionine/tyrosine aminotransferase